MRTIENHQCPAYLPYTRLFDHRQRRSGLVHGVRSRPDVDYARHLVGLSPTSADEQFFSPEGWCERPKVEPYTFDFVLTPNGRSVPEDLSPSLLKLAVVPDGYVIHNVTGVRTQIVQRLDGKGYDIRKLGQYHVRPGHMVYVNDSTIFPSPGEEANLAQDELHRRDTEVRLRLFTADVDSMLQVENSHLSQKGFDISVSGFTARFGADLSSYVTLDPKETPRLRTSEGVAVHRHHGNLYGCDPYEGDYLDSMLVVRRGHCTFLEKLLRARDASAAGIIIISDEEAAINPTANTDELAVAGDLNDVAVILLPKKIGETFEELLMASEQINPLQIMIALQQAPGDGGESGYAPVERGEQPKDPNRILYINGLPLINTRLLV